MHTFLVRFLILLYCGWVGSASAALMAPITVEGRDWLQPLDFNGLSWSDINSVCPASAGGFCTGSLLGNDMTGQVWAGVSDLNALFNRYLAAAALPTLGPGPSSSGFVPFVPSGEAFVADGWAPTFQRFSEWEVRGVLRDLTGVPPLASVGRVYWYNTVAYEVTWNTDFTEDPNFGAVDRKGAWFYAAPHDVPSPATLSLVGLGLVFLGYSRRLRMRISLFPGVSTSTPV